MALIRGGLGVAAGALEKAVEKRLILAAEGAAEFGPARGGVADQLNKCGNGAAHFNSPSAKKRDAPPEDGRYNAAPSAGEFDARARRPSCSINCETESD